MQRQRLFGAAVVFFLPATRRFFPASRSVKRMKWWIIPKGNLIEVATTDERNVLGGHERICRERASSRKKYFI